MSRAAVVVVGLLAACGGGTRPAAPVITAPARPAPAPAPAATTANWSELTGSVEKIRVETEDPALRDPVLTELAGFRGKPLDRDQLRPALTRVMNLTGVAEVAVRGVQLANGIELVVDVTAQPVLRKLGAIETGGKTIALGIAAIATGARLDPRRVQELAHSLRERYLATGHVDVDVTWRRVPVANGVEVVIEVAPGLPSTVAGITFQGNAAIASADLKAQVAQWLVVGQPVLDDKIRRAVLELERHYWDRGYVNVRITAPSPIAGPNALVFAIDEGGQFRLGTIKIKGNVPAKDHKKYLALFGMKKGDIFSRSAVVAARQRVHEALIASGKPRSTIVPLTNFQLDAKRIDLTLEITLGD